jgi:methionine sulfoxide reductase heme-binding subunit
MGAEHPPPSRPSRSRTVSPTPLHYVWWLISRASGVIALALVSLSVLMGLAMAARTIGPRRKRTVARLHEHLALSALMAIATHGLSLLGDGWLRPGLSGIAVPFAMGYRPPFTAAGIVAGYLAALVGPTFYLRRRIGAKRWRKLHRASAVVWALSVVHTLGAGSDATALWLRVVVLAPMAPVVYLGVLRVARERPGSAQASAGRRSRPAAAPRLRLADGRGTMRMEELASLTRVSPTPPVTSRATGPQRRDPTTTRSTTSESSRSS